MLLVFIVNGIPNIKPQNFDGFFDKGTFSIISTAGLVYISYVGITNIASVAEEIENPEKNLPLGVFLAIITAISVLLKTLIITSLFGTIVFRLKLSKEINTLIVTVLKKLGFSSP